MVYGLTGISAQATVGQAAEFIPMWVKLGGVVVLVAISIRPVVNIIKSWLRKGSGASEPTTVSGCCSGDSCVTE